MIEKPVVNTHVCYFHLINYYLQPAYFKWVLFCVIKHGYVKINTRLLLGCSVIVSVFHLSQGLGAFYPLAPSPFGKGIN